MSFRWNSGDWGIVRGGLFILALYCLIVLAMIVMGPT